MLKLQREINQKTFTYGIAAVLVAILFATICFNFGIQLYVPPVPLPLDTFSSYEELEDFLRSSMEQAENIGLQYWSPLVRGGELMEMFSLDSKTTPAYSTTNIQVAGVDEADIVKTDGEHLYVVSGNDVFILKAYPPEQAQMLSKINLNKAYDVKIYVNGDKLAVLGGNFASTYVSYPYGGEAFVDIYDISNKTHPHISRTLSLNGTLSGSRMIENYVYLTVNQLAVQSSDYTTDLNVTLPRIHVDNVSREIPATQIRYVKVPDTLYYFTTIIAVNVMDDTQELTHETFLTGSTACMYVSQNNMYLAIPNTNVWILSMGTSRTRDETLIYRVKLDEEEVTCEAEGAVSGYVLNQFSMDEYNGSFRIATTKWTDGGSKNNLYILDMNLDLAGKLEDLAPGEQIYSARFLGARCYLVTFRQIDPFFVIDLSSTAEPEVLGYLKIPGYSSYLHPYDEDHIIGIGKQDSNVKLSLFNVTDVAQPTETAKYIVPAEWSDSPVLTNHKAFLFDKSRQLLVLPISMNWYYMERFSQGMHAWQGAYVFNITLSDGFVVRGNITHQESESNGWDSNYSVNRALYIENTLYTVSNKRVKMNDLETLQETNEVELP